MGDTREEYASALRELTLNNSKSCINFLTLLAQDHVANAPVVLEVIYAAAKASPGRNLHYLYLVDSIMKNIGGRYKELLRQGNSIIPMFMDIFIKGNSEIKKRALHVRDTWNDVFPPALLSILDGEISRVEQQRRGGHVSPKYAGRHEAPYRAPTKDPRRRGEQAATRRGPRYEDSVAALHRAEDELRSGRLSPRRRMELEDVVAQLRYQLASQNPRAHPSHPGPPTYQTPRYHDLVNVTRYDNPPPAGGDAYLDPGWHPSSPQQPGHAIPIQPALSRSPIHQQHQPPVQQQQLPPQPIPKVADLFKSLVSAGVLKVPANNQPLVSPGRAPVIRMTFDSTDLKRFVPAFVAALYDDQPLQCKTCGHRFDKNSQAELDDHYDWHFRMNKENKQIRFRKWYLTAKDWMTLTETEDIEDRAKSSVFDASGTEPSATEDTEEFSMPTDQAKDTCKMCGEKFERFFNDDDEEWHYRDAVVHSGNTFHATCYDVSLESGNLPSPVATSPTSGIIPGLTEKPEPLKLPVAPVVSSNKRKHVEEGNSIDSESEKKLKQ